MIAEGLGRPAIDGNEVVIFILHISKTGTRLSYAV